MKYYTIYRMPSKKNVYYSPKIYSNYKKAKEWCEKYFEEHPEEKGYIENQNEKILKWYNKHNR